jgi:hypothetical protein
MNGCWAGKRPDEETFTFRERVENLVTSKVIQVGIECK